VAFPMPESDAVTMAVLGVNPAVSCMVAAFQ
jgi:hypothetical protein